MQGPWEQRVVAHMCRSKSAGYTHAVAWSLAIREHPARSRVEQAIEADVKRYTYDAYYGLKPRLASFRLSLVDSLDLSGPAGRVRQAA